MKNGHAIQNQDLKIEPQETVHSISKIAENIPDMIFEFHEEKASSGNFTYVSKAVREIFELEPTQLLSDAELAFESIHPQDREALTQYLKTCSRSETLFHWHGRLCTKSSQLKWIKVSARPEKMPDGNVKWHGVVNDITKLKVIESELEEAKLKAQQEAESKERFLATMSHEIRTPLNGIVGLTELLALEARDDQEEQLKLLKFSANSLMSLINNILDFSKLNSGKMTVSERKMKLRVVLENLRKMHEFKAGGNRTTLVFDIDHFIPDNIYTDEMMLMQVFNNLLGNAIKFTKDGTVKLSLKLKRVGHERLHLTAAVEDTGIGIPEEKLPKIFDEFEQAGSHQTGSTGLGLPICQRLLSLMGSELKVDSTEGKGSRFYFDLNVGKNGGGKPLGSPSKSSLKTEKRSTSLR